MTPASLRYELLGHLATGGMGEILLARRLGPAGFEKLVVLKRPLAATPGSRRLADALITEARLLARINHPNVCQIHDLEEAEGEYFLALELLEGLSLWTLLAEAERAGRPFEPRVLCGLFAQVCDGLAAIHQLRAPDGSPARVVHRDISPGNLFVTEAGQVKILDLGIAKHADSEDLTPFGNIKGKLPYVSPEQASGKSIDARADLFALGLVLYDFARGRRPPSDRIGALMSDALELDEVPPPLAEVIRGAVRRDPSARFTTAAEMAAALARAGAALGGVAGGAELASWLSQHHASALDEQRARIRAALRGERSRALTSRSAIDDTEQNDVLHVALDVPGDALGNALGEELRSRTEQLRSDDDAPRPRTERLRFDDDAPRPRSDRMEPPTRKRRRLVGARLAAVALAAVVVAVAVMAMRSADRDAGARFASTDAVADMVSPPAAAPAPPPAADPALPPAATPAPPPPAPEPPPPQRRNAKPRTATAPTTAPATKGEPGLLTVGSMPWADVRIGGRVLRTDVWRLELPAGRHVLHARTGDGREQNRAFQIEPGKETRLVLDWSRR